MATYLEEEDMEDDFVGGEEEDIMDPLDLAGMRAEREEVDSSPIDIDDVPNADWRSDKFSHVADPPAFTRIPGPQTTMEEGATPVEYFTSFFTDSLMDTLVLETNRYATQCAFEPKGHCAQWKDVSVFDMKAFLGICLLMGIMRLPQRDWYWRKSTHLSTNISKIMTRDRFKTIWQFFHLTNNETADKTDKLYKIRPFSDYLCGKFQQLFMPNGFFTLDESMVKWKGRLSWRQYMPNKPIRFGMKVWSLCDSASGYMYNFQVYTGKVLGQRETNLTTRVVKDLITPLIRTNARLCFDNFYTSFSLLQELKELGIHAWGTVRANRKGLPKDLLPKNHKKMEKHKYKMAQKESFLFVLWKDTKNVCFLSNCHSPLSMGTVNRRGADTARTQVNVPMVIDDYQKHMRGVDLCDQNVSYYLPELKSVKWWRRFFYYLTQVTVVNSYILAKQSHPETILKKYPTQLDFVEAIANGLIGDYKVPARTPFTQVKYDTSQPHEIVKMYEKKKACRECVISKPDTPANRKTTTYGCIICQIPIHLHCHGDHTKRLSNHK